MLKTFCDSCEHEIGVNDDAVRVHSRGSDLIYCEKNKCGSQVREAVKKIKATDASTD